MENHYGNGLANVQIIVGIIGTIKYLMAGILSHYQKIN